MFSEKNYRLQDIQLSKSSPSQPDGRSGGDRLAIARVTRQSRSFTSGAPAAAHQQPVTGAAEGGGEYRARTGDLLVANQALSQLS